MTSVWLLKSSEASDDKYTALLNGAGFDTEQVPTLTFKFTNQSVLKTALEEPEKHAGIIFTSPRSVEAVAKLYKLLKVECHHGWNEKKIFVIGEATGKAVEEQLKLRHIGRESGNAQQLAPIIIREVPAFNKPLLYPCGNLGRDELPKLLANQDRDFRAVSVYETQQHPQLKDTITRHKTSGKSPAFIVFFSPSGVNFTLPIFNAVGILLTGIKVIVIGPTTNAALVQAGAPVHGVCSSPTPESLLHTLKSPL